MWQIFRDYSRTKTEAGRFLFPSHVITILTFKLNYNDTFPNITVECYCKSFTVRYKLRVASVQLRAAAGRGKSVRVQGAEVRAQWGPGLVLELDQDSVGPGLDSVGPGLVVEVDQDWGRSRLQRRQARRRLEEVHLTADGQQSVQH